MRASAIVGRYSSVGEPPMGRMLMRGRSAAGPKRFGSSRWTRTRICWRSSPEVRSSMPGPCPATGSWPVMLIGPGTPMARPGLLLVKTSCWGVSSAPPLTPPVGAATEPTPSGALHGPDVAPTGSDTALSIAGGWSRAPLGGVCRLVVGWKPALIANSPVSIESLRAGRPRGLSSAAARSCSPSLARPSGEPRSLTICSTEPRYSRGIWERTAGSARPASARGRSSARAASNWASSMRAMS